MSIGTTPLSTLHAHNNVCLFLKYYFKRENGDRLSERPASPGTQEGPQCGITCLWVAMINFSLTACEQTNCSTLHPCPQKGSPHRFSPSHWALSPDGDTTVAPSDSVSSIIKETTDRQVSISKHLYVQIQPTWSTMLESKNICLYWKGGKFALFCFFK